MQLHKLRSLRRSFLHFHFNSRLFSRMLKLQMWDTPPLSQHFALSEMLA